MHRLRRILRLGICSFLALLVVLTFLPLWKTDEWWVRLWEFPRLQIAVLLAAGIVALVTAGPRKGQTFWIATAAGLAALGWQLWRVAPYQPLWPTMMPSAGQCAAGDEVRLFNANVLLHNDNYGGLIAIVREIDPDVVLLIEPGPQWAAAISPLHSAYPHRIGEPIANKYGIILLSKLPLVAAEIRHLVKPDVPSVKAGLRLRSGQTVDFYGPHPEPPLPRNDSGMRDAELVRVGSEIRNSKRASIVLGDLNDVGWSATSRLFRSLAGVADPRVGRGPYPTYPADIPFLAWPLDYGFATPHFRLTEMKRLPDIGSDHRAMLFGLCLVGKPAERLVPRQAPLEVREDAGEQLREGREQVAAENE